MYYMMLALTLTLVGFLLRHFDSFPALGWVLMAVGFASFFIALGYEMALSEELKEKRRRLK
jgi:hypothetical protein